MKIIFNGMEEIFPADISIADLILLTEEKDINLIVEYNGKYIHSAQYSSIRLAEGDRVEFINPNFGG